MNTLNYFISENTGRYKMKQRPVFAMVIVGGTLLFVIAGLWMGSAALTIIFGCFAAFAIIGYVRREMVIDTNQKVIEGKRGVTGVTYQIPFDKIQNWEFYSMNYFGFLTVNTSLNLYYLNDKGKEKVETLAIGFRKPYIQKVKNEIDVILKDHQ